MCDTVTGGGGGGYLGIRYLQHFNRSIFYFFFCSWEWTWKNNNVRILNPNFYSMIEIYDI